MNIELTQLGIYAGILLLGWFLRHKGIPFPDPTPPANDPHTPPWLAELKALLLLLLKQFPNGPAPQTTTNGNTHTTTVPIQVPITAQVGNPNP
jgi:hypothetical protein